MNLIDIGANLTHDSFSDDRDEVINRAAENGVKQMVLTGASEEGSHKALALAKTRPGILFSTAGVHPHHAAEYTVDVDKALRALLIDDAVVAVGECGLDYFRDFSPRDAQRDAFDQQLEIAVDLELPVFLHQRDAHDDFVEQLTPQLKKITRAVAHCFTGTETQLKTYLDMGLYIGITGWICDERRGAHLHDIVHLIPDDKLMIETDAPYLMPRTLTPKPATRRNEPAYLTEVLRVVAEARNQSVQDVAAHTTATAIKFFGIPNT
jgi:TatD DNase family protein